ncbi:MAG: hypothetical protein MUC43_08845 [Pirellula sp.]|jgi:hypothetical protein|nr:hypothetical protein [Pirellula sp.]
MNSGYLNQPTTYSLPAADIPDDVRKSLHPWIAGYIGLTPAEATKRLHDRWKNINRPSLVSLRDTLSEFDVSGIVDDKAGGLIYAVRRNAKDDYVGNSFYLPAPIELDTLELKLSSVSLGDNEAVREFLINFAGLAEDSTTAGHFVYLDSPWPTFTDSWDGKIRGFEEWENSLMLYSARNGCQLLLRRDGQVAWWMYQEHLVRQQADDFDKWINQFSEHRKLVLPYDPYRALDSE